MKIAAFRKPAAWIPITISLTSLLMVVGHAFAFGIVHEVDEGTAAPIGQLLMVVQMPVAALNLFDGRRVIADEPSSLVQRRILSH